MNVRYADRTYAKVRDVKIFTMAIASAQAALSESVTESVSTLENVLDSCNARLDTSERNMLNIQNELKTSVLTINTGVGTLKSSLESLQDRVIALESADPNPNSNLKMGFNALGSLSSRIRNAGVGFKAGENLIDGNSNTFLGFEAGQNCIQGSNNLFLGSSSRGNYSNEIVIGNYNHRVIKSNTDVYTPAKSKSPAYDDLSSEGFSMNVDSFKALQVKKLYKSDSLFDIAVDYDSLRANLDTQTLSIMSYNFDPDYIFVSKSKLVPMLVSVVQNLISRIEGLEQNV